MNFSRTFLPATVASLLMTSMVLMCARVVLAAPTGTQPLGHGDDAVCYIVADDSDVGGGDGSDQADAFFVANPFADFEQKVGLTGTMDVESVDFLLSTHTLYAADESRLGTIDVNTGVFTALAKTYGAGDGADGYVTFDDVDGLAFDQDTGVLYASVRRTGDSDLLIQLDVATGARVAGAFGGADYVVVDPLFGYLRDVDDLAFDPTDGSLYGTANVDGNDDHLIRIDKTDGSVEKVGKIRTSSGTDLQNFEALTSTVSGQIIGVIGGHTKEVYDIDKHSGVATKITTLSLGSDYESVTCITEQAPPGEKIDVELTKEVDETMPQNGTPVTFTITVTNKGPADATGVEVKDKLPEGLWYATSDPSQGTYNPATGRWTIGYLGVGQVETLEIVAQVRTNDPITNVAEVTRANEEDVDSTPGNHDPYEDDQDDVTLTPRAHNFNLCIQKWVDNPAPNPGDEVTFTIRVCNDPLTFTDIEVLDPLPDGLTYVSHYVHDKGSAQFNPYTHVVQWVIPSLGFAETATIEITVRVDTDYSVENCARIAKSVPPDNEGDNESCATVTPGETSGGGDGGVESEGNLATALAHRLFNRRQDAHARRALQAAPTPEALTLRTTAAFLDQGPRKTHGRDLSDFVPQAGPLNTQAFVVTPTDLLGLTNATSIFAADYLRPEGRRMAALFGATSPAGVLYDHAKATCDRLGGGSLESVRLIEIDDHPFVLSRLVHADGTTDYAVSFVAYDMGNRLLVDSRFAPKHYDVPADAQDVMNLQVWSITPEVTASLVHDILGKMAAAGSVDFVNTDDDAPQVPDVFVRDGAYTQGRLTLRLVNRGTATSVIVRGSTATTEVAAEQKDRMPFSFTVPVPEPPEGEDVVEVSVDVGQVFDTIIEVEQPDTGSLDQLYYADGAWSYAEGEAATVDAFETFPQDAQQVNARRYEVPRSAHFSGNVTDWASLFRYLRPNAQPVDLSGYQYVEFTAWGYGTMQLILEKASITSWDQFGHTFSLSAEPRTIRIPFREFTRNGGMVGFTAEDVTLAAFYAVGNGQLGSTFDVHIDNLAFVSSTTTVANENEPALPQRITLEQNYPNPFNPSTHIDFSLTTATHVRLAVYDMLGRQVAVLEDGVMPAGTHTVSFDAGSLPTGAYVYRLITPTQTLTRQMVLMK